jgi:hypothetical protein
LLNNKLKNSYFKELWILKKIMRKYQTLTKNIHNNQEGTASIISTFIIVILLSLITIGFAKIMNRSLQESLNSNLSSAADYAAQSGVNDALSLIKAKGINYDQPDANSKCGTLGKLSPPNGINYNLSSDTKYTCILIHPKSDSLLYSQVDPFVSRVVDVSGSSKLMFSWESTDGNLRSLPNNGGKLLDEKSWKDGNLPPMLRLTLYGIGDSLAFVQEKTVFFYPVNDDYSGGINTVAYGSLDGSTQYVNCGSLNHNYNGFNGTADLECNVVIEGLSDTTPLEARLTPLYSQARIEIKGNKGPSSDRTQFSAQTTIDVTAWSGGATKRLQVRVDNQSQTRAEIPEYALRTTNLLCKRLTVSPEPYGLNTLGSPVGCAIPPGL